MSNSNPVSAACLQCRRKHLRCDGSQPKCSRCTTAGIRCTFVESRRGFRGAKKTLGSTNGQPEHSTIASRQQRVIISPSQSDTKRLMTRKNDLQIPLNEPLIITPPLTFEHIEENIENKERQFIEAYYRYIHPAHPFLLPRKYYLQDRRMLPSYLRNMICFIASHHTQRDPDEYWRTNSLILDPRTPDDLFKVQSLILLALASYARFERDVGNRALSAACDAASRIGLNSNTFSEAFADPTQQECCRRTWWELYTLSGLVALIGGSNYNLEQPQDMLLPTHCKEYEACRPLWSPSVEAMRTRFDAESQTDWSSLAYKVEATRILRTVLDLERPSSTYNHDTIQASIASFIFSIPAERRTGLDSTGEVDEVMSCTMMIIHLASICLNFPRSSLAEAPGTGTICNTDRGRTFTDAHNNTTPHFAALRSANELSKLISSRTTSLTTLSPCFSCAIAFAAVVHISECLLRLTSTPIAHLKVHVDLELSALNVLGGVWPVARVVRAQIAQFSRQTMTKSAASVTPDLSIPTKNVFEEAEGDAASWLGDLIANDYMATDDDDLIIPSLLKP